MFNGRASAALGRGPLRLGGIARLLVCWVVVPLLMWTGRRTNGIIITVLRSALFRKRRVMKIREPIELDFTNSNSSSASTAVLNID